jgi:hypothetical protein
MVEGGRVFEIFRESTRDEGTVTSIGKTMDLHFQYVKQHEPVCTNNALLINELLIV